MTEPTRIVNKNIPKIDGLGLVKGSPAYTDDLAPRDPLIVKLLRSPYAFARIKAIDVGPALVLEGVACALSWKDVPRIPFTRAGQGYPEPSPQDKFIFDEFVRYVGDEVALVAAETEEIALSALGAIKVEYEVLEPLLDFEASMDNRIVIHPEAGIHELFPTGFAPQRNIAASYKMEIGDLEAALAASDIVVHATLRTHAQSHVAMEPHAAFSYVDTLGRLNVVTSTQTPFHTRRILGRALDIPLSRIRVVKPRIGGGFGGKQHVHLEPYVSLVTLKTGRPAKASLSRREVFESSFTRHQMRYDMRIGSTKEGIITAIDMKGLSNTGAYGEHALTVFMVAGAKSLPLYNRVQAVAYGGNVVYTNKVSAGAFRGYGAVQGNYALESAIDELAAALAMDPAELRKKNMIREGQTSEIFAKMGEGGEGLPMVVESCKLEYCIARGMELIGWDPNHLAWEVSPGIRGGKGMAIAMQGSGIPLIDMGATMIELQDGGCFKLRMGATDLGTGSDTILAQIVAEELGVELSDIIVYSSDTDHTPFDVGAYASSTTYVSGNAALEAARKMKRLLTDTVAENYNLSPSSVCFDGRSFLDRDGNPIISLKQFSLDTLYHNREKMKCLSTNASYTGHSAPPPYMAGFAEVKVDTETGKVWLERYVAVVDCGTPINPNLARIQMEGGLLQGIGMALFENVKYNEKGRLLTNSMNAYPIPSRRDVGEILVEFADSYEPTGPFGAKSIGEIGVDTPPAAIANALRAALGIRISDTPFTPEKVLKAIRSAKEAAQPKEHM